MVALGNWSNVYGEYSFLEIINYDIMVKYMLDHYLIINITSKYGAFFYNKY